MWFLCTPLEVKQRVLTDTRRLDRDCIFARFFLLNFYNFVWTQLTIDLHVEKDKEAKCLTSDKWRVLCGSFSRYTSSSEASTPQHAAQG